MFTVTKIHTTLQFLVIPLAAYIFLLLLWNLEAVDMNVSHKQESLVSAGDLSVVIEQSEQSF